MKNKRGQSPIIFQKKNSKGQFYLIATLILAGLIIGFVLISNYSSNKDPKSLKEMAEELKIEGGKVLDYDLMRSENKFEEEFSGNYSIYAGEDKEIYFILVDGGTSEAYKYDGASRQDLNAYLDISGSKIIFRFDDMNYEFKKEKGKNFYFLLAQEYGGEKYVISG